MFKKMALIESVTARSCVEVQEKAQQGCKKPADAICQIRSA
jgi:hypothetical protein